ncbi:hypothetical protein EBB07_13870 [Paenibacillaceae bacterium]|nr:hypothetical protein EBB07_13870 [Paenibacillaceae bacterium]
MKVIYVFLLCFTLLISGCERPESVQSETPSNEQIQSENPSNEDAQNRAPDYESMFFPPNFTVTYFAVLYENKSINITIDYEFNVELYELLKSDVKYSFMIAYPQEISNIINKEHSEVIETDTIDDTGKLNYKVNYSETLTTELTKEQIDLIIHNTSYGLFVLNSDNKVFSILNDLIHRLPSISSQDD